MSNNESVADSRTPAPGASSPQAAGPQIEVTVDEDWKTRVKAEDAALDQQFRSQPEAEATPKAESPAPTPEEGRRRERPAAREMPDPTFGDLVGWLATQAMMFLGEIPNPSTQRAETQLPVARYFIDMVAILEEKTAGQLTKEESNILAETLHSLRMTYMQRSKPTA
jgi:Domain of unknown function (DUF1844)